MTTTVEADSAAIADAHTKYLYEFGASNAARIWKGRALRYTTVDGAKFLPFPAQTPTVSARTAARKASRARSRDTVHLYDITTRDGHQLRIVYIRYAPGTWSNVDEVTDVYEVSIDALTALDD